MGCWSGGGSRGFYQEHDKIHISIISKPVVTRDKAQFSTTGPSGVTGRWCGGAAPAHCLFHRKDKKMQRKVVHRFLRLTQILL